MTIEIDEFLPDVLPFVDQCPEMVVRRSIRNAIEQVCSRGKVWNERTSPETVYPNIAEYYLTPGADTRVVEILEVWFNDTRIYPYTEQDMEKHDPEWRAAKDAVPDRYIVQQPGQVRLYPKPNEKAVDSLEARVALAPISDSAQLPEHLIRYRDAIRFGAFRDLFFQPQRPWTDFNLARYYERELESKMGDANVDSTTSFGSAPARVKAYP